MNRNPATLLIFLAAFTLAFFAATGRGVQPGPGTPAASGQGPAAALLSLLSGQPQGEKRLVPAEIEGVAFPPVVASPVVIVVTADRSRYLSIGIGPLEAAAIQRGLENISLPRPMTHDLLAKVIGSLGGRLEAVTISRFADNIFFAELQIDAGQEENLVIDARSSDAMALAIRLQAPLFIAESVLEAAGEKLPDDSPGEPVGPAEII